MRSALIIYSRHTKNYAKLISKKYKDAKFLEVSKPPTKEALKIKNNKDIVIGIGGGSVIDTAKIISKNKRCVAIPTTAAGASVTPYATVWGRKKISVPTKKPILRMDYNIPVKLPLSVIRSTAFDALSHAIESLWSNGATPESRRYSKKAILLLNKLLGKIKKPLKKKNVNELITAGNIAGRAIAIAKTNVVHAISYEITILYGIDHGTACGMLLPHVIEYMDFKPLPKLFNLNSTEKLAALLKKLFTPPKIKHFNPQAIANKALKYGKINHGPKKLNKKTLTKILTAI